LRRYNTLPAIDLTAANGNTMAKESAGVLVKVAAALGHPACLAAISAVAGGLVGRCRLKPVVEVPGFNA
jgi:hypothetical protein